MVVKSERIVAIRVGKCIFINVYFPVYNASDVSYHTEVAKILSTLDSIISDYTDCSVILGSDFNLSFANGLSRCDAFGKFIQSADLRLCDTKGDVAYTYCSEARNAVSFIDHFFVSKCISEHLSKCLSSIKGTTTPMPNIASTLPFWTFNTKHLSLPKGG